MHYVSCDPYEVEAAVEVLRVSEEIRQALRDHRASVRSALTAELADLLGY